MKKPTGLGRGLSALIDESVRPAASGKDGSSSGVREVELSRIRPNPSQPRQFFDEAALGELTASVAEHGVLQPVLLRAVEGGYELVAGERRWRAAQAAQLHRIPAIVREFGDEASAEIALIENIQRADLNAIEEGEGYRKLVERYGHTQEVVAKLVGKSRSHIANLLRLLDLPRIVREMLLRGDISMGHARAIVSSPAVEELAREIVAKGLSVRQAEARARVAREPIETKSAKPSTRPVDADLAALERQLGDLVGLRVRVAHGKGGGTVTLHYSSLDQLDMICQRLSGEPI